MEQIQAFEVGYPWAWLNDVREAYLLTATASDQGQSTIFNTQGPDIVNPPFARVSLRFSLDGNICYTPWFPMNISPMIVPTPNQVRSDIEVVVEARQGITITVDEFDRGDFDQAPFD